MVGFSPHLGLHSKSRRRKLGALFNAMSPAEQNVQNASQEAEVWFRARTFILVSMRVGFTSSHPHPKETSRILWQFEWEGHPVIGTNWEGLGDVVLEEAWHWGWALRFKKFMPFPVFSPPFHFLLPSPLHIYISKKNIYIYVYIYILLMDQDISSQLFLPPHLCSFILGSNPLKSWVQMEHFLV